MVLGKGALPMNDMLFEELNGQPVARGPIDPSTGAARVANGRTTFNLSQAVDHWNWSESALRELYAMTLSDLAAQVAKDHEAEEPAKTNISSRAHEAGKNMLADLDDHLLRNVVYPQLRGEEFDVFMRLCRSLDIDPWRKRVIPEVQRDLNGQRQVVLITTVEQLRIVADRSGRYAGQSAPQWRTAAGEWVDFWEGPGNPSGARVAIQRHGFTEPCWGVVHWEELAQYNDRGELLDHWLKMPALMIAKCAEVAALRKGFPEECGGLFVREEVSERRGPRRPALPPKPTPTEPGERVVEPCYDDLPYEERERMARAHPPQQRRRMPAGSF
jgi:phage recombination protein Bet